MKKVWANELGANTILRNLILKTQRDSLDYSRAQSSKEAELREEIQELQTRLDLGVKEAKFVYYRLYLIKLVQAKIL